MTSVFMETGTPDIPLNPFLPPILTPLASPADESFVKAAADIIATITDSPDPANSLWQFWDAFFTTVVCTDPFPLRYGPHLALLNALHAHPPTEPKNVSAGSDAAQKLRWSVHLDGKLRWSTVLPRFLTLMSDAHGAFEASRHLKATVSSAEAVMTLNTIPKSGGGSCARPDHAQCYLRMCAFSAMLLKASGIIGIAESPSPVFFACVRALEHERPTGEEREDQWAISSQRVWALDVLVAATWLKYGGPSLWNADQGKLREAWSAAMDEPTELWKKEGGLTRDRWQFWATRLERLRADDQHLNAETRAVVGGAAGVVNGLLSGTPTMQSA